MHDPVCNAVYTDTWPLPEHCFDHIDASGLGIRMESGADLVPSTMEGCLWSLESTWVCDGGAMADPNPSPAEPVVDFIVANPTLFTGAGKMICEVSDPVIITLVMTIFILGLVVALVIKHV